MLRKLGGEEDEVQYHEKLFSILANNTNDVFLMFTASNYSVEYVSPNVERVLGISQEEIMSDIRSLERSVTAEGDTHERNCRTFHTAAAGCP